MRGPRLAQPQCSQSGYLVVAMKRLKTQVLYLLEAVIDTAVAPVVAEVADAVGGKAKKLQSKDVGAQAGPAAAGAPGEEVVQHAGGWAGLGVDAQLLRLQRKVEGLVMSLLWKGVDAAR